MFRGVWEPSRNAEGVVRRKVSWDIQGPSGNAEEEARVGLSGVRALHSEADRELELFEGPERAPTSLQSFFGPGAGGA